MTSDAGMNLLVDCLICGQDRVNRNPRLLSCQHGFCQECIERTRHIKTDGDLQCPVCMELTQLPEDGVAGLQADTKADKVKKAMQTWRDMYCCTLCPIKGEKSEARVRCRDCDFRLCHACAEEHKTKSASSSHLIIEKLCNLHIREFFHGCVTCRTGLCHECLASEFHEDHTLIDLQGFKENAHSILSDQKSLLQSETERLDWTMRETLDKALTSVRKRRTETEEKLEHYKKKIFDAINIWLDKRDGNYHRAITSALEKQKEACSQAAYWLDEMSTCLHGDHQDILDQLLQKTSGTFRALNVIRTSKFVMLPELAEDECTVEESGTGRVVLNCTIGDIVKTVSGIYQNKPEKVLSLRKLIPTYESIDGLRYIQVLPDGSALLGQCNQYSVIKVNLKGEITGEYSVQKEGYVRGLGIYGGEIYIVTFSGGKVTVISESEQRSISLKPRAQRITDLAVDSDYILLVDDSNRLWRYSYHQEDGPDDKAERVTDQPLGRTLRISVAVHPDAGTVYLVSDDNKQQLKVYRSDLVLIRKIGEKGEGDGQFSCIRGSTMLPNGNILVVDSSLHRVSEFSFEGEFIRFLLTLEDGLYEPHDLAFAHPYLWIACWEKALLFTYD